MLYAQNIVKAAYWGLFIFLLSACRPSASNAPAISQTIQPLADTTDQKPISNNYGLDFIDTVIALPLVVDNENYIMKLIPDEVGLEEATHIPTTTVSIVRANGLDTVFKRTYDFNSTNGLYNPAANIYWLGLISSGGGSGYQGTLFNIRIEDTITLQPILNFGELTYWRSNRNGSQILVLDGIWNMGGDPEAGDFESHFGEHIHAVSIYTIQSDTIIRYDLGVTKNKYTSDTNMDDILQGIEANEPELAKKLNLQNFK